MICRLNRGANASVFSIPVIADKHLRVAKFFLTKLCSLMRASILQNIHAPLAIPHHDHRPLADHRRLEITLLRDFALERNVAPMAFVENPLISRSTPNFSHLL